MPKSPTSWFGFTSKSESSSSSSNDNVVDSPSNEDGDGDSGFGWLKKTFDTSSWQNPMDMDRWKELANDADKKLEAAMWSTKSNTSGQEDFLNIIAKLSDTMTKADELVGRKNKLTFGESITPVMFMVKAYEAWTKENPGMARKICEHDEATEVTLEEMKEADFYFPFAEAAYGDLEDESFLEFITRSGYNLVYNDLNCGSEMVAHYIAYNPQEKICVISVKGTSTLGEVATDLIVKSAPFLPDTYAHEGIRNCARRAIHRVLHFLKDLFNPLDYKVILTGHSLGAGSAALMAVILREELDMENVRAVVYASPPVLDRNCALKCKDYVLNVINDRDLVARSSLSSLSITNEVVVEVNKMLKEGKISQESIVEQDKDHGEKESFNSLLKMLKRLQEEYKLPFDQDIYTPGKVLFLFRDGGKYDCMAKDGTLTSLRQIILSKTMVADHLSGGYRRGLRDALANRFNAHSVSNPPIIDGTPGTFLAIPEWRFFHSAEEQKDIMFYHIQTKIFVQEKDDKCYFAWRRFNNFHQLNDKLKTVNLKNLPPLPSKLSLKKSAEERGPQLEDYLIKSATRAMRQKNMEAIKLLRDFVGAGEEKDCGPKYVLDALEKENAK